MTRPAPRQLPRSRRIARAALLALEQRRQAIILSGPTAEQYRRRLSKEELGIWDTQKEERGRERM